MLSLNDITNLLGFYFYICGSGNTMNASDKSLQVMFHLHISFYHFSYRALSFYFTFCFAFGTWKVGWNCVGGEVKKMLKLSILLFFIWFLHLSLKAFHLVFEEVCLKMSWQVSADRYLTLMTKMVTGWCVGIGSK